MVELEIIKATPTSLTVKVNGIQYTYALTPEWTGVSMANKVRSIMKYSHGKALKYLKDRSSSTVNEMFAYRWVRTKGSTHRAELQNGIEIELSYAATRNESELRVVGGVETLKSVMNSRSNDYEEIQQAGARAVVEYINRMAVFKPVIVAVGRPSHVQTYLESVLMIAPYLTSGPLYVPVTGKRDRISVMESAFIPLLAVTKCVSARVPEAIQGMFSRTYNGPLVKALQSEFDSMIRTCVDYLDVEIDAVSDALSKTLPTRLIFDDEVPPFEVRSDIYTDSTSSGAQGVGIQLRMSSRTVNSLSQRIGSEHPIDWKSAGASKFASNVRMSLVRSIHVLLTHLAQSN